MKVFWYCNSMFPPLARHLGRPVSGLCGWQYAYAESLLSACPDLHLALGVVYNGHGERKIEIDGIVYYLIPCRDAWKYSAGMTARWREALDDFKPDIIHLHGTEFPVGLALLEAAGSIPAVASIQGLVTVCARYYNYGMTVTDLLHAVAFRDFLRPGRTLLPAAAANMAWRGKCEVSTVRKLKHIIGRTSWDRAHVLSWNPEINYHFCNESLREIFYTAEKWSYCSCNKHTIFVGSSSYPLKGAHQIIKAMALVVRKYPDARLRVVGSDPLHPGSFKNYLKLPGYAIYLRRLINRLHLAEHVTFLGQLPAEAMVSEFQHCNCCVLPSAIENSPNTLGEAQLLGTPVIASYSGGIPDMIADGIDGYLYRFEEVEMLAQKIDGVFSAGASMHDVSTAEIAAAEKRHDRAANARRLLEIYNELGSENRTRL